MEARFSYNKVLVAAFVAAVVLFGGLTVFSAEYSTSNFVVRDAPTPELAKLFGDTAERCRAELSQLWLGKQLPDWSAPCPISIKVCAHLGAGGQTSFIPTGSEVYGWDMRIQGSVERIVDSVLPHEITHMILASHFCRPLPRWLDEGAATSVEHVSEQQKYRKMLLDYLDPSVGKALPFNKMVTMQNYPSDPLPLYSQGHAVVELLLTLGGHRHFVNFAERGMENGNWSNAVHEFYGYKNLGELQTAWIQWMQDGSTNNIATHQRTSVKEYNVATTLPTPPPLQSATPMPSYAAKTVVLPGPSADDKLPVKGVNRNEPQVLLEWSLPVRR